MRTQRRGTKDEDDALAEAARVRGERHAPLAERGRAVGRRGASPRSACSAGSIVIPTLIGLFVGRWLDRAFGTGIFWTAPLLVLGLALGCWSAGDG